MDRNPHPFPLTSSAQRLLSEPMSPNARAAAGLPLHSGTVATDPAFAKKDQDENTPKETGDSSSQESKPTQAKPKPSVPRPRSGSGNSDSAKADSSSSQGTDARKKPPPLAPPPGTTRRQPKPKTPTKPSSVAAGGSSTPPSGAATPPPSSATPSTKAPSGTPPAPPSAGSEGTPASIAERRGSKKRLSIAEDVEVLPRSDEAEAQATDHKDFRKRSATPYPTKDKKHGFDDDDDGDDSDQGSDNGSPAPHGRATAAAAAIQGADGDAGERGEGGTPNPNQQLQSPPPPRISKPRAGGASVAFASSPDAVHEVPVSPEAEERGAPRGSMAHRKPSFEHIATPKPHSGSGSGGDTPSGSEEGGDTPAESVRSIADDSDMDEALQRGKGGAVPVGFTPLGAPGGHVPTPHPSTQKSMDFSGAGSTDEETGDDNLQGVPEGGPLDTETQPTERGFSGNQSPKSVGAPDLAGAPPPRGHTTLAVGQGGTITDKRRAAAEMHHLTRMAQAVLEGAARRLEAQEKGGADNVRGGSPIVEVSVSPSGEGRLVFQDARRSTKSSSGPVTTLTVSMTVSPSDGSTAEQFGEIQHARAIQDASADEQLSMIPPSYPPPV